ncbi:Sulfotransferase family protein [Roseivivax jejudonensis]|uniref:Sulfotransferase family protein n=1 Tax=Roseivivax jejudonensis TaxID=1529041 RepID=A0A1X6Z211_9RHOB|nr:sulfotransferase family 2 domain-containing protein [Roseivivax jejudonensis]SLN38456.1 Sulfotransferase family protein [Roseivivax jejudonensis]
MRRIQRWMLSGRGYAPDMLASHSAVAVFPRLGIVFNRIKKSGNTSIAAFLHEVEGHAVPPTPQALKAELRSIRTLSLAETWAFPRLRSLAVVREPGARALSGFLHHVAPGTNERHAAAPGYGDRSPEGFAAFLAWLEAGNLDYNAHFRPQTALMFQPPGRFTWILRLERLSEGMRGVLRDIGEDPAAADCLAAPHEMERAQPGKLTGSRAAGADFLSPSSRAAVARLYAADYAAFDYPRPDP